MQIACLSDIHANYFALSTVVEDLKKLEGETTLILAGDFLNTGPHPKETLALLRELNPQFIKGNHEEYLLNTWQNRPSPVPWAINAPARWTINQLDPTELEWLSSLPDRLELTFPGAGRVVVIHASPTSNRRGIFQFMSEEQIAARFKDEVLIDKTLYLCGHVHRPVLRPWQGVTIAGAGSVGQSADGDSRACYVVARWDEELDGWQVQHRRVEYDRAAFLKAMQAHSAFSEGGPVIKILAEGIRRAQDVGYTTFLSEYITEGSWAKTAQPMQHLSEAVERYLARIQLEGVPEFVLFA